MIRSIWKPVFNYKVEETKNIRCMTILKEDIGKILYINGLSKPTLIEVIDNMVGNKYGTLCITRKKVKHQIKKKKKK